MKKSIVIGSFVIAGLALSSFVGTQSDYVQISLHNPCSKDAVFTYSSSPNGSDSKVYVNSNRTEGWSVKRGKYINYKFWGDDNYKSIGKVEHKGQVFNCRCN